MRFSARSILLSQVLVLAIASATPALTQTAPKVLRLEENLTYGELLVVGSEENVNLPEFNVTWKARIDSGATTTSIHALNVEEFERDGDSWVRFEIRNDENDVAVEAEKKVERYALIRKRGDDGHHRRAVVKMDVVIGDVEMRVEVNLSDRTGFDFPILIGRNYLSGTTLIDVSRDYIQDTPEASEE